MTIPYWRKLRRNLRRKFPENRQWHANVRILKFILEANRNSLAKERRGSRTIPGSQLSNCGTIKTYTWHNQGNGMEGTPCLETCEYYSHTDDQRSSKRKFRAR